MKLAPSARVSVVVERERESDPRLELVLQEDALHGLQIWGEDDLVLLREDQTHHAEAHPADLEAVLNLQNDPGDALHQASGRSRRRVAHLLGELAPGVTRPAAILVPPTSTPTAISPASSPRPRARLAPSTGCGRRYTPH